MDVNTLLPTLAIGFLTLPLAIAGTQPNPAPKPSPLTTASVPASLPSQPKRLTIDVSVVNPQDLKVKEGDTVKVGQLIADRSRERTQLTAQKRELDLVLKKLAAATITVPLPPAKVPAIAVLPSASYEVLEAEVDQAKVEVGQAEGTISLKKQEIAYLQTLESLNPLVLEHEQNKLKALENKLTGVVKGYQTAVAKLGAAKRQRQYQEYERSIAIAQRTGSQNQATLEYQQQLANYEQRLRDREFQVSQTQLKLDEVNNAIASLAGVQSPYAGKVRRIKWGNQGADGRLSAQVLLIVRPGRAAVSEQ